MTHNTAGIDILLHDEVQLLDYGESRSAGPYIKLRLNDPDLLAVFRGLDVATKIKPGHILNVTIAQGDIAQLAEQQQQRAPNRLAQAIHKTGYFMQPQLWEAVDKNCLYTQERHKKFVEGMPCLAATTPDGFFKQHGIDVTSCTGDVVLHHCRKANNAGGSQKPPHWYGVPVCHNHHQVAHSKWATREFREWLVTIAVKITAARMKEAVKVAMGLESLSEVTIDDLRIFEVNIGLATPIRLQLMRDFG